MNKLCIVSCDKIFARMLEIELQIVCPDIKTVTEKLNPPALSIAVEGADHVVFDGDYYGGELLFVKQTDLPFTIFSKNTLSSLPENVNAFFERPFVVSDFVKHIAGTSSIKSIKTVSSDKNEISNIKLDYYSKQVTINGNIIKFSPREFSLFSLLYKNRGKIVLRQEVIDTIWGNNYNKKNNADNVYINYLRNKLDNNLGIKMIYTIRGKGYMMK